MTTIQTTDIVLQLEKWCNERHLDKETQRKGLVANLLEELSEFYRAKDEYEQVDALCDMIVFCINSLGRDVLSFMQQVQSDTMVKEGTIISLVDKLQESNHKLFIYMVIKLADKQLKQLGYDTYKCLLETIKEISSRTGEFNSSINKFVKEPGAYSYQEAYKLAKQTTEYNSLLYSCRFKFRLDYENSQTDSDYYIFVDSDRNIIKIKKWYKANYVKE